MSFRERSQKFDKVSLLRIEGALGCLVGALRGEVWLAIASLPPAASPMHLVIRSEDLSYFQALQIQFPGQLFLGEAVSGHEAFAEVLRMVGDTLAEEPINSLQANASVSENSLWALVAVIAVWTGFLAISLIVRLILAQKYYLRRRLLTSRMSMSCLVPHLNQGRAIRRGSLGGMDVLKHELRPGASLCFKVLWGASRHNTVKSIMA